MNIFKRIGKAALGAASYITPNVIKNKIKDFTSWLHDYVEPTDLDKALDELKDHVKSTFKKKEKPFLLEEHESALKGFTKQYKIKGQHGYDPDSFLVKVKPIVTKLFTEIPETKIKLILNCNMERTNMETDELIHKTAKFRSNIVVNLAATDVNEVYDKMTHEILEEIANFNQSGSGWVFEKIVSLDIFTVDYVPLRGSSYISLPPVLAKKEGYY